MEANLSLQAAFLQYTDLDLIDTENKGKYLALIAYPFWTNIFMMLSASSASLAICVPAFCSDGPLKSRPCKFWNHNFALARVHSL